MRLDRSGGDTDEDADRIIAGPLQAVAAQLPAIDLGLASAGPLERDQGGE